ncbi:HlyD family secretion protein [Paraferrimonas haliotis]|uniref:Hemolysin D n=1 Tax=Paraferrimonas haliotis TaxID=2013866 RepID=A0AA37WW41_9GAMM|nr:HlyD family secretion protein [Paraferrimonas haliotis]GLS82892.1 hemolysin D [Paraferrimonas haliotis]
MTKLIKTTVIIILLGALGIAGYSYWSYSKQHPSTSNAYVHANLVSVAPQVSGTITKLHVSNFAYVKKGDALVSIDATAYALAVTEAKAAYQSALQLNESQNSAIDAAIAQLNEAKAELSNAQKNAKRTKSLVEQQLVPQQAADDVNTQLADAQARMSAAQANVQQAVAVRGGDANSSAAVQQAAAKLAQAELNLSYTEISAPFDGYIGSIEIHDGSLAQQGRALFPIVKQYSQWIRANFKESQMTNIQQGQPVTVTVDMYPDEVWHGVVDSLSPASGSSFSLLPPENATGNWVKVGQRFPIKIRLTDDLASKPQLRVGASSEVTIDTTAALQ